MREIRGKHFPVISPLGVAAVAGAKHPRTSTKTRVSTKPLFLFFFVLISTVIYVAMILLREKKQRAIKTRVDRIMKARSCVEPFCNRFRKKE